MEKIEGDSQTVKYADIIDNSIDIAKNDKDFAPKYLSEVKQLLSKMNRGNPELYRKAQETVQKCIKQVRS